MSTDVRAISRLSDALMDASGLLRCHQESYVAALLAETLYGLADLQQQLPISSRSWIPTVDEDLNETAAIRAQLVESATGRAGDSYRTAFSYADLISSFVAGVLQPLNADFFAYKRDLTRHRDVVILSRR